MTPLERFVKRLVEVLESRDPGGVHRPLSVADLRGSILPYRQHRAAIGLTNSEDYEILVLRLVAEEGGFVRTYPPESAERARAEVAHPNPDVDLVESMDDTTVQIGAAGLARILAIGSDDPAVERPSGSLRSPLAGLPLVGTDGEPGESRADQPPTRASAEAPAAVSSAEVPAAVSTVESPVAADSESDGSESARSGPAESAATESAASVEPAADLAPPFEPIADSISVDEEAPAASPSPNGPEPVAPSACPACSRALPTHRAAIFCPHCGVQLGVARCPRCSSDIEPGWRHCIVCGQRTGSAAFA
ncbi:MAG: zinc ribbon domain-containing protein [Gemmatimonadales bacterium]|nr:zinc ribbon domain-containing protein [Gemmatimonadales bacterium]